MTARRLICLSVAVMALFAVGFTSSTAQAGWEPNFWRWTGLWWSDGYHANPYGQEAPHQEGYSQQNFYYGGNSGGTTPQYNSVLTPQYNQQGSTSQPMPPQFKLPVYPDPTIPR